MGGGGGGSGLFARIINSTVAEVAELQDKIVALGDPQVELHLLRSCAGVCKINHLLCSVDPDLMVNGLV